MAALGSTALITPALAQKDKDKDKEKGKEKEKKKHHHNNGKDKLGEKIKQNGSHVIDKKGDATVAMDVKDNKIAGMKVKHAKKGDLAVKKYKTKQKMAQTGGVHMVAYDTMLAQAISLGTTYIGYAYIDDWGDEVIYWYPVEMIYDGETGAIDYVPVY